MQFISGVFGRTECNENCFWDFLTFDLSTQIFWNFKVQILWGVTSKQVGDIFQIFVAPSANLLSLFESFIFIILEWHTLSKAAWYTYGTLLGEAITRDTKSGKSKALRIAIATWILYCLIISQGYGGSLKAYLSTPAFSNPIDTLQQVSSNFWTRAL